MLVSTLILTSSIKISTIKQPQVSFDTKAVSTAFYFSPEERSAIIFKPNRACRTAQCCGSNDDDMNFQVSELSYLAKNKSTGARINWISLQNTQTCCNQRYSGRYGELQQTLNLTEWQNAIMCSHLCCDVINYVNKHRNNGRYHCCLCFMQFLVNKLYNTVLNLTIY